MQRHFTWIAVFAVLVTYVLLSSTANAQIVSDVSGEIELRLNSFTLGCSPSMGDCSDQIVSYPVGMGSQDVSIDGHTYPTAGGLSQIDYDYTQFGPSLSLLDFHATAETLGASDGGGGYAELDMLITVSAPVRYRFEGEVIEASSSYRVAFNGTEAVAYTDQLTGKGGTFPILYYQEDGVNVLAYGWDPHIDEGILPAGQYHLNVRANAGLSRYYTPTGSGGTASLTLQLLGDANLDDVVGVEDLNAVLADWNASTPLDGSLAGDLDGDGFVGITDLNDVLSGWGSDVRPAAQAATIPEPVSAIMLLALSPVLLNRVRTRPGA